MLATARAARRSDVPTWTEAKVHPDHHVQVARALYSVPTRFIGRTVRTCAPTRSTVRIYLGTELVKAHTRASRRATAFDRRLRLPRGARQHAVRAPQRRGTARASQGARRACRSLARRGSCSAGRCRGRACVQAYGLIRAVCDTYGDGPRRGPFARALSPFGVVDVSRIGRMLKAAAVAEHTRNGRWQGRVDRDAAVREVHWSISRRARHRRRRKVRDGCTDHLARPRRRPQATGSSVASSIRSPTDSCSPRSRTCRSRTPAPPSCSPTKSRAARQQRLIIVRAKLRSILRCASSNGTRRRKSPFDKRRCSSELASSRFLRDTDTSWCSGPWGRQDLLLASALGHIACRHGYRVRFQRARRHCSRTAEAELDSTTPRDAGDDRKLTSRSTSSILDDFALEPDEQGGEQGRVPTLLSSAPVARR